MRKAILVLLSVGALHGCAEAPLGVSLTATPRPSISPSSPQLSVSGPSSRPSSRPLSVRQIRLLQGARGTLGAQYDDGYYGGGPPPKGRGACTDVIYEAYLADGLDLQQAIEEDISRAPQEYPNLGDANINYRRAPNLIVWFERHMKPLPKDRDFQPGDVVFWNLTGDGVADHVGLVSDRAGKRAQLVIHNFPPACREDDALWKWTVVGHYRR